MIGLIIITLLNDGTIISIAYDHVIPSKRAPSSLASRAVISSARGARSALSALSACPPARPPAFVPGGSGFKV